MVAKLLLLNVLCFISFCRAMDVPESSEQTPLVQKTDIVTRIPRIERHEHILFIPLQYVRPNFETLETDVKKQQQIQNNLSECPLFRIGLLPDVLQKKIVMYAVDHHEKAAEKFVRISIRQVYEIYNEICKHVPIFIGDKMLSEHMLFAMNPAERAYCYKLHKPSFFDRYILGISHEVTQKEYDFLSEQRRNDILSEDIHNIRVVSGWSRDDWRYKTTVALGPSLFLATSVGLGITYAVTRHTSYLAGTLVFLASAGLVFMSAQAVLKGSGPVVTDGFITQIEKDKHNEEELIVFSEDDN